MFNKNSAGRSANIDPSDNRLTVVIRFLKYCEYFVAVYKAYDVQQVFSYYCISAKFIKNIYNKKWSQTKI